MAAMTTMFYYSVDILFHFETNKKIALCIKHLQIFTFVSNMNDVMKLYP